MENTLKLDEFDRLQAQYEGLPGVLKTHPSTIRVTPFLAVEGVSTWIVQTIRHAEAGDLVFIESLTSAGHLRIVLPPQVAATIARHREGLASKARSKAARARAETRDSSHLLTPEVRAKALKARKAKAAKRRERKQAKLAR